MKRRLVVSHHSPLLWRKILIRMMWMDSAVSILGMMILITTAPLPQGCLACTVFIAGKDATVDGSVLVSHSNDGEFDTDPRLVRIPAQDHDDDDDGQPPRRRPVFFSPESYPRYVGRDRGPIPEYYPKKEDETSFEPIGSIPQIPHTLAYLEDTYGAINEYQVGIGESTCSGIFGAIPLGAPNGTALWSIDELTHVAMERTTTARDAIQLMGSLAERDGFYGAGEFEGTAESLGVTDPKEAWIFHILPDPSGSSAIWVAQRIPDDHFAVLANMFVIREIDPNNTKHFLMSASVHDVAKDYGWWRSEEEDGLLDFTKIYSDGEYAHKFYSGRRMWGGYHLACPSQAFPADYVDLQSDPVYPVSCKPDRLLSQMDLFQFHRYYYQNTTYDLSAPGDLAAGPFGSPDRWKEGSVEASVTGNWERAIGLYRTSDTYVVQSRQDFVMEYDEDPSNHSVTKVGNGVLWFGPASALATVFTPFIVNMEIPSSFQSGHQAVFDRSSAFWASCFAHNVANLKWSYAYHDVTKRQLELEQASVHLVEQLLPGRTTSQGRTDVEKVLSDNAAKIVASLWSLSDEIVFKYASGFINEGPDHMSQVVGYPAWWLKAVGSYQDGPPPPPTQPKCCHPRRSTNTEQEEKEKELNTKIGNSVPQLRRQRTEPSATATETHRNNQQPSPVLTGKAAMRDFLLRTSNE